MSDCQSVLLFDDLSPACAGWRAGERMPWLACNQAPATRCKLDNYVVTYDWPDTNQLKSTLVNWSSIGIKSPLIGINLSFIKSTGPFLRTTCCRESRKMEKSPPGGRTMWTSHNRWRGMMILQNTAFSMVMNRLALGSSGGSVTMSEYPHTKENGCWLFPVIKAIGTTTFPDQTGPHWTRPDQTRVQS